MADQGHTDVLRAESADDGDEVAMKVRLSFGDGIYSVAVWLPSLGVKVEDAQSTPKKALLAVADRVVQALLIKGYSVTRDEVLNAIDEALQDSLEELHAEERRVGEQAS